MNEKKKQMPFGVPMVWRKQVDHHSDFYFCMNKLSGFSQKNISKIVCLNYHLVLKPVSHGLGILVPFLLQKVKSKIKKPTKEV